MTQVVGAALAPSRSAADAMVFAERRNRRPYRRILLGALVACVAAHSIHGQGSLTPPGAPAPTMKSLQQVWEEVDAVATQLTAVQDQNTTLLTQNATLQNEVATLQGQVTALQTSAAQERFLFATLFQEQLPWRITTIEVFPGLKGSYSSLAFGPAGALPNYEGQPAISYFEESTTDLWFAWFDGELGSWREAMVDVSAGDVGRFSSLAFGPDGTPAIAYHDSTNAWLKFIRLADPVAPQFADQSANVGQYCSLAFGPDGQPAISHFDATNGNLRFTRFNGTNWNTVTVHPAASEYTSLKFGPDEQPAIAYNDGILRLARFNATTATWDRVTVDAAANSGHNASLAFGPDGQPAIAYWSFTNTSLRFARFDGASWTRTTVGTVGPNGSQTSLAFGPDGQPTIAYHDAAGSLRFARLSGTGWNAVTVDATTSTAYASLAFGPDGQPAIAYNDSTNARLRFAQRYVPTP